MEKYSFYLTSFGLTFLILYLTGYSDLELSHPWRDIKNRNQKGKQWYLNEKKP